MSQETEIELNELIAERIRSLRIAGDMSLDALSQNSGVSRSMISLIERAEVSPTAVVLDRLASAFGLSLSALLQRQTTEVSPLSLRAKQLKWRDPESGYERRTLSPPSFPSPMQLVEITFPAGARVTYDAVSRDPVVYQQVWIVSGAMQVTLGDDTYALSAGDCLAMTVDRPTMYFNPGDKPARYVISSQIAGSASKLQLR
jgi:transcriptional regulator with XRE-family HTH domain